MGSPQHPEGNRNRRRWFPGTPFRSGSLRPAGRFAPGVVGAFGLCRGSAAFHRPGRAEPGFLRLLRRSAVGSAPAAPPLAQRQRGGQAAEQGSARATGCQPHAQRQGRRAAGQQAQRHRRSGVEGSQQQHRHQRSQQRQQQQAAQEGQGGNAVERGQKGGFSRRGRQRPGRGRGPPSDAGSPAQAPGCQRRGSPESPPSPRASSAGDTRRARAGQCARRPRPGS